MAVYTTIDDASLYCRVKAYSGSGSSGDGSSDNIVYDETDTSMKPQFVWVKNRTTTHAFTTYWDLGSDTLRYFSPGEGNDAEVTPDGNVLSSFNSNGFTVGPHATVSGSGNSLISVSWKEDADGGYDFAMYTGNGTAGNTFSHSLSAVPHFILIKIRSGDTSDWYGYNHRLASANTKNFFFNTTGAESASSLWWNSTTPTSSVVTLGNQTGNNGNTRPYAAFLWTEKQGYSKFGTYLANNATDGNFLYLGFRPAVFLVKSISGGSASARNWRLYTNKQDTFNQMHRKVYTNAGSAEVANDNEIDFLSNGIKLRANDGGINTSGETYLFAAWAEAPFVNSKGIPCNAR